MPRARARIEDVSLDEVAEKFLSSKKESTSASYRSCLKRFSLFYGKMGDYITEIEKQTHENEGKSLVNRTRPGEDVARNYINWLRDNGYSNKAILQSMAALQNCLKFYGITLSWSFIETPPNRPMSQNEKYPWTLQEMKQLVDICEYLRDKAMILVAFQSGLGVSDLVALNYGDVRKELEAGTLPLMLHIFRQKTGVEFRTFLGRDAALMVRQYLKSRGSLADDDPLFTMLGSQERVTKAAFQRQLRALAPKLPFILNTGDLDNGDGTFNPARPHSLRSAFRSRLTGKMDGTLIEFLLGHNIGEEKKAYLNLPVEELREIYASYEHLLAVEKTSKDELTERQGKEKIPEQALKRIQTLEATVNGLAQQNTLFQNEVNTLKQKFEASILMSEEPKISRVILDLFDKMSPKERMEYLQRLRDGENPPKDWDKNLDKL
jgi:site-specific recombinase XerD